MQATSHFKRCQSLLPDYFDRSKKNLLDYFAAANEDVITLCRQKLGPVLPHFQWFALFFPPYYSFDPFTLYIKMIISNQLNPLPHTKYRHMQLLNLQTHACGDCEVMLVLWNAHLWLLRYSTCVTAQFHYYYYYNSAACHFFLSFWSEHRRINFSNR